MWQLLFKAGEYQGNHKDPHFPTIWEKDQGQKMKGEKR